MLRISTRQLVTFRRTALTAFEEHLVAHCQVFAPKAAAALGKEQLGDVVHAGLTRAEGHGLTLRGPVRLFVELGFLFGSGFDADVQYPWVGACLDADPSVPEMDRAAALHEASVDAVNAFRGPESRQPRVALHRLRALVAEPPPLDTDDLPAVALAALTRVHPEKCAYVGEPALRALIAAGAAEAARYGLSAPRDVLLLTGLMFAYGQHCADDPIHPWIGQALRDPSLPTPAARARQLEEKALGLLRGALANREPGT